MEFERQNSRPQLHSRMIPQGPTAHKTSAFGHLELGQHDIAADEPVFTSAWLWQSSWLFSGAPIRVAVTFPDEWIALQKSRIDEATWQRLAIDFWVFRDLNFSEKEELAKLLADQSSRSANLAANHRMVVVASFLSRWKDFISEDFFRKFSRAGRAFIHFVPKKNPHDPFLNPQEVLWELKKVPKDIAIFTCDYSEPILEEQRFFQTIHPTDNIIYKKPPVAIRILRLLDRIGLESFVNDIESFVGLLVDGNRARLGRQFTALAQARSWTLYRTKQFFWFALPILNALFLYLVKKPIYFLKKPVWFLYPKICQLWSGFKNIPLIKWKLLPIWNGIVLLALKRPFYAITSVFWKIVPLWNKLKLAAIRVAIRVRWDLFALYDRGLFYLFKKPKNAIVKLFWALYPKWNRVRKVTSPNYFLPKIGWKLLPIWNAFVLHAIKRPYYLLVKLYHLRGKAYQALLIVLYPLRKIYWMVEFQIQKRLGRNA